MHKIILYLLLVNLHLFSQPIDFQNALSLAIENNKQLKSKKLDMELSNLDVQKVQQQSLGELKLLHEASRTNHAGYVFNSKLSSREARFKDFGFAQISEGINTQPNDLNSPEDRNNFTSKLTYDIPLFTGFKLSNQEKILKIKHKAQQLHFTLDKKSLEYEVLKAYNSAVVAKEFIKASTKAKEAVSLFVQAANAFYEEGLVTKIDKKQARVQELNVQSKITQAHNNFDLALAYLRFLTANPHINDVSSLKLFLVSPKELNALIQNALLHREEIKIAKLMHQGMEHNVQLNKASNYPNIYSHIEYGFNDNTLTFNEDKDYYMALLGIQYTLYNGSTKADIQKSQIELNKTALQLSELNDAISLEVEKALLNLKAKDKLFKEAKEAKELAYEVLEQSKLMYKNQLIAMTELLKQEATYRQNEAELILAHYEKSLASAHLKLTIGDSLHEN